MRKMALCAFALAGLVARPAGALDILLTNDDGYTAPGILALRTAFCAAGHAVTLVASTTNQSGRGGALNTGAFSSGSAMALTRVSSDVCGAVYSLAPPTGVGSFGGTPVDAANTGLDVVLAGNPPDLVLSGLNQGQNMGKGSPSSSGTVGAALAASLRGVPAIAGSVGIDFAESGTGFPSTNAAYAPASEFMVRLVAALEAAPGDALLPKGVTLLNVNFPVPYANIVGVRLTALADSSDLALPIFDRNLGFPPVPPIGAFPNCLSLSDGQACSVMVAFASVPGPDPVKNADTDAYRANLISITPMDGDMTSGGQGNALIGTLRDLAP